MVRISRLFRGDALRLCGLLLLGLGSLGCVKRVSLHPDDGGGAVTIPYTGAREGAHFPDYAGIDASVLVDP